MILTKYANRAITLRDAYGRLLAFGFILVVVTSLSPLAFVTVTNAYFANCKPRLETYQICCLQAYTMKQKLVNCIYYRALCVHIYMSICTHTSICTGCIMWAIKSTTLLALFLLVFFEKKKTNFHFHFVWVQRHTLCVRVCVSMIESKHFKNILYLTNVVRKVFKNFIKQYLNMYICI